MLHLTQKIKKASLSLSLFIKQGQFFLKRMQLNQTGVAAVEFALILPILLILYLGTAETTQGITASRDANLTARTVVDLIAQQPNNVTLTDTQINQVISATSAIMAPFSTSPLKMTMSSVEFVTNSAKTPPYDAKPRWTISYNGGTLRPCAILTPVANTVKPSATTLPTGVYASGSIIVVDVIYTYTPSFGSTLFGTSQNLPSFFTYQHSTYMKPRAWSTPIPYSGSLGTVCPSY